MIKNTILNGDCLEVLKTLSDKSVNCCVTSPPYYGLRDYGTGKWVVGDPNCPHKRMSKYSESTMTGHAQEELRGNVGDAIYKTICPLCGAVREDKQVGLEETPEEYIDRLIAIFEEVKRVLTYDGTLWINIGDSYAGGAGRWGGVDGISDKQNTNKGSLTEIGKSKKWQHDDIKPKDLIGIPWMLAFALRNSGWYLRQDIIWQKPNPLPESVKDRCTKSHEYIFLFAKSPRYYFDYEAIQEPCSDQDRVNYQCGSGKLNINSDRNDNDFSERSKNFIPYEINGVKVRNKRDVWRISPSHYSLAHFATFPTELVEPMILAGCPRDGIVLDPFMGSGTTAVVAKANHRNYLGIELNPEYVKMAEHRIKTTRKRLI